MSDRGAVQVAARDVIVVLDFWVMCVLLEVQVSDLAFVFVEAIFPAAPMPPPAGLAPMTNPVILEVVTAILYVVPGI